MFAVIEITHHPAEVDDEDSVLALAQKIVREADIEVGEDSYRVFLFPNAEMGRKWHERQPVVDNVSYWHGEEYKTL